MRGGLGGGIKPEVGTVLTTNRTGFLARLMISTASSCEASRRSCPSTCRQEETVTLTDHTEISINLNRI